MPPDSYAIAWRRQREWLIRKANALPCDKNIKKNYSPYDDELERGASEIKSRKPGGIVHAGEVSRRSDRQTNALPPPDPSNPGGRQSNTNPRRKRPGGAAPGGGFNNDSDSDDERNGSHRDGRNEKIIRRRQQIAQPAEAHDEEQEGLTDEILSMEERNRRAYRCMKQALRHLKTRMTNFISSADQTAKQNELLRDVPADERPGAIQSDIYEEMLQCVDILDKRRFDESVAVFMRHSATSSASTIQSNNKSRPYVEERLKSGQFRCEYVDVKNPPALFFDLCMLLDPPFRGYPSVFRVLVKDNRPIHAEPINPSLLETIGFRGIYYRYPHELLPSADWWRY